MNQHWFIGVFLTSSIILFSQLCKYFLEKILLEQFYVKSLTLIPMTR